MDDTASRGEAALAVGEARLARAAAAGDGSAFAALYERYEQRAFNLAYRTAGSEADAADAVQEAFLDVMRGLPRLADRELAFRFYLFTATHSACHDLMDRRQHRRPSETHPESAAPLGSGAGGPGLDQGDPEGGAGRKALLESQQEEVREASMRLPERQREVLALRELEELSYEEIAAIMEMNRDSVAQLISRARINLSDELRGTVLASIAAPSPECERALPLIAARHDGQLDGASRNAAWLDAHLAGCDRCRLGVETMQEAGASYRAWAPIAAAPWLLKETMAKAAELAGADWSEEIAETAAARTRAESLPGTPSAYLGGPGRGRPPRRRVALAAGLAALLLLAGLSAALAGNNPPATPGGRAASAAPGSSVAAPEPGAKSGKNGKAKGDAAQKTKTRTTAGETASTPAPPPAEVPTSGSAPSESPSHPHHPHGKSAVQPTQQTSPSKPHPTPTPAPTPAPASQPASGSEPAAAEPPPAGEPSAEPSRRHEPPGKPPGRPPPR